MKLSKEKREMLGYDEPETIQKEWIKVGDISVDAGLCWVGDPCYILHKEGEDKPKDIGKSWYDTEHEDTFCGRMKSDNVKQFYHDMGFSGLGVCVSTGYGDGVYPVEARFTDDDRVAEIRVKFITD